jgi:hypothetical protein
MPAPDVFPQNEPHIASPVAGTSGMDATNRNEYTLFSSEDEAAALERDTFSGPLQGTPEHSQLLISNAFPRILHTTWKVMTEVRKGRL